MDKLIIGAGLYGLYAALYCAKKGQQVEVLEMEEAPFTRATYINQANTRGCKILTRHYNLFFSVIGIGPRQSFLYWNARQGKDVAAQILGETAIGIAHVPVPGRMRRNF